MRIDSHVHLWTDGKPPFPFNDQKTTSRPDRACFVEDLIEFMDEHKFDRAVLVQTFWHGFDNSYMCHCIDRFPDRIHGVALIDPHKPDAAAIFERLNQEHGVQAMRLYPITTEDASWLCADDQLPLWETARRLGLSFTWFGRCAQLPHLEPMLVRFPEVNVVVDHLGEPILDEGTGGSFQNLLKMAKYPNLFVKATRMDGISDQEWPFEDVRPFVKAVYENFGADRMIGWSGFPLNPPGEDMLGFRIIEETYDFLTQEDLSWLQGKTSARIYVNHPQPLP
jgi:L-fuconolactonase